MLFLDFYAVHHFALSEQRKRHYQKFQRAVSSVVQCQYARDILRAYADNGRWKEASDFAKFGAVTALAELAAECKVSLKTIELALWTQVMGFLIEKRDLL